MRAAPEICTSTAKPPGSASLMIAARAAQPSERPATLMVMALQPTKRGAWGRAGEGVWQKVGGPCTVCGPDGCDHTHPPTGLEQSLDEMEFARSACSAATSGDITKLRRCIERKESASRPFGDPPLPLSD